MSPRTYRMGARAATVAATRARIVGAAMELHATKGVMATGWDEIGAHAGVSPATVYRHFPSIEELVPACARTVFDVIRPPTVEEARTEFAAIELGIDRLEALERRSCHCYADGEAWLHAAYRERDFVPSLDAAVALIETTLEPLVAAAGRKLDAGDRNVLFVLCNFPFWKSLRDRGFSRPKTEETAVRLVRAEAARLHLDRKGA